MPASKSLTPGSDMTDHPASSLRIGDSEDVQTLLKLTPVTLPNVATVQSLCENYSNDKRWTTFRSDPRYIYVMNWMYQCRGYIKLASEHFDADLFEIELFELVHPPPLDELTLLVNKTKLALLGKIHGKKIASLASFEPLFRIYFGNSTPLGGKDLSEDEDVDVDHSEFPRFDDLYIDEKIGILYLMMLEVTQYPDFREFIDKNKLGPEQLRTNQIYSHSIKKNGHEEDYFLALDNTALYKRNVVVPELIVPKKRKLAPQWPDEEYGAEKFDSESIEYELIFRDIYGLNDYIGSLLANKKNKKNKAILDVLQQPAFISNVFSYEIRKRKILSHRRKDLEMARLLATRKRSLRLEAKEKQRNLEEQERKLKEMEELQYAASRRRSQRAQQQLKTKMTMDYTQGLSREERFNLRMQKAAELANESPALSEKNESEAPTEVGEGKAPVEVKGEGETPLEVKDGPIEGPSPSDAIASAPAVTSSQPNLYYPPSSSPPSTVTSSGNGQLLPTFSQIQPQGLTNTVYFSHGQDHPSQNLPAHSFVHQGFSSQGIPTQGHSAQNHIQAPQLAVQGQGSDPNSATLVSTPVLSQTIQPTTYSGIPLNTSTSWAQQLPSQPSMSSDPAQKD
ncbi:CIC11C00000001967 [Sungouiella intermedia]|uniref:CIC11C00000001967 n=1 Tax=Sungouiella intermedia TaxID=45354 RepID=A0A1L0DEV4_9ASCO|nr:CIC11C00000001967 [[Candida] intermedia]